jgi:hypothetical protein
LTLPMWQRLENEALLRKWASIVLGRVRKLLVEDGRAMDQVAEAHLRAHSLHDAPRRLA